ncbi:GNAT family N-acetyltransferase [Flavobacterium aestuarii]|uniref:GNAT family N-acetyltransferase n=1 Tax=Flavobacterium aestuarii TaxID=3149227 RepID=UPI0032B3352B
MEVILKNIRIEDEKDLVSFLNNAGSSLNTFRYFSTRTISILNNHITTILLYEDQNPVGYGHLDKDGETIWLGICVSENKERKGYGKLIIDRLIEEAQLKNISRINLSVDINNHNAVKMYVKYGFVICNEIKPGIILMELELKKLGKNVC